MKVLMLVLPERVARYSVPDDIPKDWQLVYMGPDTCDEELLAAAKDAEFIFADAVRPVSGKLIRAMPDLKLIHSEGAGYNMIDVEAARECGIHVCNCSGFNAPSVAEQAILLMLGVLRRVNAAHQATCEGKQIDFKHAFSQEGIPELGEKIVGFVGFGAIAQETAKRLKMFGCTMYYNDLYPASTEIEQDYGINRSSLEELFSRCDIISLHVPVTPQTRNLIDAKTIAQMKTGVILINTARGDLICQEALVSALISGKVSGAGLDVLTPEPVLMDNPLLNLPAGCKNKVLFSPHIAGISQRSFAKAHAFIWKNFRMAAEGNIPNGIVV